MFLVADADFGPAVFQRGQQLRFRQHHIDSVLRVSVRKLIQTMQRLVRFFHLNSN